MSTIDSSYSRVQFYDRKKDFIADFMDDCHVRIMKLFPFCTEKKEPIETNYKRFHMRFYIPREIYHDKYLKVDKLFIFLNGLNELDHFTLYDQLGQGLAKHGYASVLLPLPNHLNRNRKYRFNDTTKEEKPSDTFIEERDKIYSAYVQLMSEINVLVDHLRNSCKKRSQKCAFYKHFFDSDLRISILGYSIGGLGALSAFLLQKNVFNSCILLNSGSKLDDIDVSYFISLDKWKNMVKGIQKDWETPLDDTTGAKIFDKIFLGNRSFLLKEELKEVDRKILFTLGGADTVTRYKSIRDIEPDGHGLSILKLPGIHHFLSIDTEWNKWFKIVINTIAQFDESACRESLSYSEILNELILYQIKYNIFDGCNGFCIERIDNEEDRSKFHRIIYAAESSFGSIASSITEMYLLIDKMSKHPKLYPVISDYPTNKLLGAIAVQMFGLKKKVIRKLLKTQKEMVQKGKKVPKFGQLLVKDNYLSKDQLSEILALQRRT